MTPVVLVMTVLAAAGLSALVYIDWLPPGRLQRRLASIALIPLIGAVLFVPSAADAAIRWCIDRTTKSIMDDTNQ